MAIEGNDNWFPFMNGDVTIPTTMRFRPNQYAIAPRFEAAVSREHDSGGPTAAMTVAKKVVVRYTVTLLLLDAKEVRNIQQK